MCQTKVNELQDKLKQLEDYLNKSIEILNDITSNTPKALMDLEMDLFNIIPVSVDFLLTNTDEELRKQYIYIKFIIRELNNLNIKTL